MITKLPINVKPIILTSVPVDSVGVTPLVAVGAGSVGPGVAVVVSASVAASVAAFVDATSSIGACVVVVVASLITVSLVAAAMATRHVTRRRTIETLVAIVIGICL